MLCRHDGHCYSRDLCHWSRFAHKCELAKEYCPLLLAGMQCYNKDQRAHNEQFSHGPLPSAMIAHRDAVSAPTSSLDGLKQRLLTHLEQNRASLFVTQHRSTNSFALAGSFKVGTGSTNPGFMKHLRDGLPGFVAKQCKNGGTTAHYVTPVEVQLAQSKISRAQWIAYQLASQIIQKVDPDYAAGEYNVQFALMNASSHFVKKHRDSADVDYQYALALGSFSGAILRAYNEKETAHLDFDYRNRILRMDGRLAHEVLLDHFDGDRYTVIWYKNFDQRYPVGGKPLLHTPSLVDESQIV